MNSEELEQSLRTEFESYLNNVRTEMRQEVYDFQEKFQAEFEKHKSHLDEIFRDFSARLENEKQLDEPFKESVVEHLRLARDEGASITAAAIAEAEEMQRETDEAAETEKSPNYSDLRDAINDITAQDSQSGILKALVNHAAQFTPRGAFFIIKNEYFVGWRVFGEQAEMDEQRVREIYFPVADETVLGESVRSLAAVETGYGTFSGDEFYLGKLEFGQPERMFAVPLIARGRGVAVLYADAGAQDETSAAVNIEALETLVRIAGLTVELLASSQTAKMSAPAPRSVYPASAAAPAAEPVESESEAAQAYEIGSGFEQQPRQQQSAGYDYAASNQYGSSPATDDYRAETSEESETEPTTYEISDDAGDAAQDFYSATSADGASSEDAKSRDYSWNQPAADEARDYYAEQKTDAETPTYGGAAESSYAQPENSYTPPETPYSFNDFSTANDFSAPAKTDFDFSSGQSYDGGGVAPSPFENVSRADDSAAPPQSAAPRADQWQSSEFQAPTPQFETPRYDAPENYSAKSFEAPSAAPAVETATVAQPVKTRLSERNVDLPIEVAEDERRLHNDARRFARLLVSEIKLYNEQKVKEGRESADLYERLREAIDRSREMYNKRVQPPVAAKFDYFHYELVSNLAEGDESSLGSGYPGAEI